MLLFRLLSSLHITVTRAGKAVSCKHIYVKEIFQKPICHFTVMQTIKEFFLTAWMCMELHHKMCVHVMVVL